MCSLHCGAECTVLKWIKNCIQKGVEELELNFMGRKRFKLPSDVLDIETIKVLKFSRCEFNPPPQPKGLHFLNTLVLRHIEIHSSKIAIVLRHCSFLESLDLAKCKGIGRLVIDVKNNQSFKSLKVGDCRDIARIDIDAPALQTFYYSGKIFDINFTDILNLNDAMITFQVTPNSITKYPLVETLIYDLMQVRIFTTSSIFLEELSTTFKYGMQFDFWNLVEFQIFMEGARYCNVYDIAAFLKNCPSLQKLFIDLSGCSFEAGTHWELHYRDEVEKWRQPFKSLKYIKIKGFRFAEHAVELVRYLLMRATALETLELFTPRNETAGIHYPGAMVCGLLNQQWKANPKAEIKVHDQIREINRVCPKHSKIWWSHL